MIDAATYDAAEQRARESLRSWAWSQIMTESHFDRTGFPKRVHGIRELMPYVESMSYRRFHHFMRELGGLSETELTEFFQVLERFLLFFRETFQDREATVPLNTLMAEFTLSRKLRGVPDRSSILEIGAGSGYLPFFCPPELGFRNRAQIEVTQCFYLLQACVNSFLFGPRFEDMAISQPRTARVGTRTHRMNLIHPLHEPMLTAVVNIPPVTVQYPWWRVDDALDGKTKYDVVISNGNMCEMSFQAFQYYFQTMRDCLTPDAVVLIQDLGAADQFGYPPRLRALIEFGYRPLVYVTARRGDHYFATDNVVLVMQNHPHWQDAAVDFGGEHFPTAVPLVRRMFGLDRKPGIQLSREELFARFAKWFSTRAAAIA